MQHAVLDEKTNSKNILEKAFFFILSGFFPNWEFVSEKFEKKAHLRCETFFKLVVLGTKIENFQLI
jgi:hypothetical protein